MFVNGTTCCTDRMAPKSRLELTVRACVRSWKNSVIRVLGAALVYRTMIRARLFRAKDRDEDAHCLQVMLV